MTYYIGPNDRGIQIGYYHGVGVSSIGNNGKFSGIRFDHDHKPDWKDWMHPDVIYRFELLIVRVEGHIFNG